MNPKDLAERLDGFANSPVAYRTAAERLSDEANNGNSHGRLAVLALEAAAVLRSLASVEPTNPAPGYCPHCKQYTIAEPLYAAPPIPADKGCARNQGTTQFCAEAVEKDKEIERLKKALERVQPYIEGDMAEVESLRKDAERYRWLRTRMTWRHESRGTASNRTSPPIHYSVRVWYHETSDQEHDTIDAAIDAALGKSK